MSREKEEHASPNDAAVPVSRGVCAVSWALRTALGVLFLFSGFVKAVDPWGTLFKFNAYCAGLGITAPESLQLVGTFLLSAAEFCIGLFFLLGIFRKTNAIAATAVMGFMLPLTFWIAVTGKVEDCGCFGDAIHIGNWATFTKNLFLTAGTLWLLKSNDKLHWSITPALQWLALLLSLGYVLTVEFIGYIGQPMLDFRPYAVGTLLTGNREEETASIITFTYSKNGIEKEFSENDSLPDEEDGWSFVRTNETTKGESFTDNGDERTFRLWDRKTGEDATDFAIRGQGNELMVLIPDLKEVSPAVTWKLNALHEWTEAHGIPMIAVVAGTPAEIRVWEDLSMAAYDIFTADDTHIKEVVRGNPGIVFLSDGVVRWKTSLKSLDVDDFTEGNLSEKNLSYHPYDGQTLKNLSLVFLSCIAVLITVSFVPVMKKWF